MMLRKAQLVRRLVVAAVVGLAMPSASRAAGDPCAAPPEATGSVAPLPRLTQEIKPGGRVSVLAIGSATLFGPEASLQPGALARQSMANAPAQPIRGEASERAFPRQMAMVMEKAVPDLSVRITVRGGRGMTANEMLALLRRELAAARYDLVLWQTGTVEAVRNTPPGEFAQTLSAGAEAVEEAGANLVLIDPQFSRFLQTNSNLDPYVQALQQVASMPGVLLFHRFDLMRHWANEGQIDLERTPKADRVRVGDALHACLGAQLARMVLAGAQP